MKIQISTVLKISALAMASIFVSQPVMAAKFKCWKNNEGVRECGTYVPAEYSQKRIETRGESGRVIEVEKRAKNKTELAEEKRLAALKKIEDAKIAEQKKKDDILLKIFTRERDINMLRESKFTVIEGIITVINSNNKALNKKLEKLQKRAANSERRGKKPPQNILADIKMMESRISKNERTIKIKLDEKKVIQDKSDKDLQRFRKLKGIKTPVTTKPKPSPKPSPKPNP